MKSKEADWQVKIGEDLKRLMLDVGKNNGEVDPIIQHPWMII